MKIEQIYTGCLAQGAYYIESNGEVAIIDPLREVNQYVEKATSNNAKIKYIFETHFHADFVSGHKDLADKTGATIVFGPTTASVGYNVHIGTDGETFKVGNLSIKLIHTPGHTMESSCYLLSDENGKEHCIFTGDTLFIGDVGRPDLAQHVISDLTQEKLASHMFDSLRNKIIPLNDNLIVYPAHGAGSACGKNLSKETFDTLGNQKKTNYALNLNLSREEFIKELITGLTPPPAYFPNNVLMNIQGYDSIDNVINQGTKALELNEFEEIISNPDVLLLDTRAPQDFANGFIPGSINIGLKGSFAVWVGTLVTDIKQKIVFVGDLDTEEEVVTRLARVGYDHCIGFLKGGIETWINAGKDLDFIQSISSDEFFEIKSQNPDIHILDVRKKSEHDSEHIIGVENIPLDFINQNMDKINTQKEYFIHCAGGYRSMIFASILKARGFNNLIDVAGGFGAIKNTGKFDLTAYVCPSTML